MKRKTLKKALAGISAIAMIGTALPTSLIASAVSYNGISNNLTKNADGIANNSTYGYDYLYESIKAEKNDNDKMSPLVPTNTKTGTLTQLNVTALKDFNFMLKKYEKDKVEDIEVKKNENGVVTETITHGYVAKSWDVAAAKEDVKKLLNGKDNKGDVIDVTFYDDADDEKYGCDAYGEKDDIESGEKFIENRYGKIKSITLNMPVNKGKGGAGDITYEAVEFTVARTARDVNESSDSEGVQRRGLILVNDINLIDGTEGDMSDTTDNRLGTAFGEYKNQLLASAKADIIKVIDEKIKDIDKSTVVTKNATTSLIAAEIKKLVDDSKNVVTANFPNVDFSNGGSAKAKVISGLVKDITASSGVDAWITATTGSETTERAVYYKIISEINKTDFEGKKIVTTLWSNDIVVGDKDTSGDWAYNYVNAGIPKEGSTVKQLLFDCDVDIFLNGYNLITPKGIQVNGSKMRIWGTNEEQVANAGYNTSAKNAITSADQSGDSLADQSATLTAFAKGSVIELYDDVYVSNLTDGADPKPVVEGDEGTLIICGDAVVLEHAYNGLSTDDNGKVIDTAKLTFEQGDYTYYKYNGTNKNTGFANADTLTGTGITGAQKIYTYKNHMYNKYGLEVNARPEDPASNAGKKLIADSTDYTDTNARTAEIDYGFQPAYKTTNYDHGNTATSASDVTYDYTASASHYATANEYVNTALTPVSAQNIYVTNLGQLMWVNANMITLASGSGDVTINIDPKTDNLGKLTDTNVIDFNDAPKSLVWNPVDASVSEVANKIIINGKTTGVAVNPTDATAAYQTDKYAVIKNMRIASENGDAAMFSKTNAAAAKNVTVQYVGFEQPVVSATGSNTYGAVVAGVGSNITISNVYVAEPTITATYKAAIAGVLNNGSTINNTFSYGAVDPVYTLSDNGTRSKLVANNTRTNDWYSNIFASDYKGFTARGTTNTYFKSATVEEFNDGTVAFMLNKHDPEMEIEASKTVPIEWNNGVNAVSGPATAGGSSVDNWGFSSKTISATGLETLTGDSATALWYRGTYASDTFGQALEGSSKSAYPTFIVNAANSSTHNNATNRVFREISKQCSGEREEWTADNAVFANTEVRLTSGHEDGDKNGRCDTCGAYEIANTKNFDPVLWTGLKEKAAIDDSKNTDFITLARIGSMTDVTFDLRANMTTSKKTMSDIMNVVLKQKADGTHDLTGFDLLSKRYTDGTELSEPNAGSYINTIKFNVDDKIACTLDVNDYAEKGFEVFSMPYSGADLFAPVVASGSPANGNDGNMAVLAADDEQKVKGTEIHYYVAADNVRVSGAVARRANTATFKLHTSDNSSTVSKIDGLPTGYKAQQVYTFQIKFSELEHYGAKTAKDGLYNDTLFKQGAVASGDALVTDGSLIRGKKSNAYHTIIGNNSSCGCIVAEEEHDSTYAITNAGHFGKCPDCNHGHATGWVTGDNYSSNDASEGSNYEPHVMQQVYTFGNMVFERCQICGYSTFKKETAVLAKSQTPELSIVVDDNGNSLYRQTYQFDVTAGSNTILNYGVVYRTDGKSLSQADVALAFNATNGVLDEAKLEEKGLSYTRKTAITESGTYTVNKSLDNADATYSVLGYLVSQNGSSTPTVITTPVLSSTFRAAAQKEVNDSCAIEGKAVAGKSSTGADNDTFTYRMELSNGCQAKTVANIFSKVKGYSVTDNTTVDTVDGKNIVARETANTKPNAVIVNLKHAVSRAAGIKTTARAYMVVTNEKYGDLEFIVYSDVVKQAD